MISFSIKHILAVMRKELKVYLNSPIAYVFLFFFLVISSWLFLRSFFIASQVEMQQFFDILPWLYLFFIPAITMRLFAEEKKMGTIEVLMTMPVNDYEVVVGKFLGSFLFLLSGLILSFPLPVLLGFLGNPDYGQIVGSYLGALFLGSCFLVIGMFISSMTKNQIVAFIFSLALCFSLYILSTSLVLVTLPGWLAPVFNYVGIQSHYASISRGVIDSRDIVYYLTLIGLFLYLNWKSLETGKYK